MCTICDLRIDFNIDHPMTLLVAVATRRAIGSGLLAPLEDDSLLPGLRRRAGAIAVLQGIQQRLEASARGDALMSLPDFFIMTIESRTWGYFRPTPTGFDPNCRPNPLGIGAVDPADRDAVIVAAETTLDALLAGRIPFNGAWSHELIAMDADANRSGPLRAAFGAAFPTTGFSRFVCH